jgi:hypothetical protein
VNHSQSYRKVSLFMVFVMIAALFSMVAPVSAATHPTVSLVPRVTGDIPAGQQFRVDLTITGLSPAEMSALRAVTAEINFDTEFLTLVDVHHGSLLDAQPPQVSNVGPGKVSVSVSGFGNSGPFVSSGAAFSFVFEAKQNTQGYANITIAPFDNPPLTSSATGVDVIYDDNGGQGVYATPTVVNAQVFVRVGGMVIGQVVLQGRSTVSGIEVVIRSGDQVVATLGGMTSGDFWTSPGLPAGRYSMTVQAKPGPYGKAVPYVSRTVEDFEVRFGENTLFPSFTLKAGDVTGSDSVNGADLVAMATHWRSSVATAPESVVADLDGDGVVYGLDLALLARNWQVTAAPENLRALSEFEQYLNNRILINASLPVSADANANAQAAENVLRAGGHLLDAAKMTILGEVITELRFTPIRNELLDNTMTLAGHMNSTNTTNAINQASAIVVNKFANWNAVDFRDIDNELAAFTAGRDVLDIARRADDLVTYLQSKLYDDQFIAAYIWANNTCGTDVKNVYCFEDMSEGSAWAATKNLLIGAITNEQWWITINHGINRTNNKNP